MPQGKYSKKGCKVRKVSKRIILPIELSEYNELSQDAKAIRAWLDTMIATYPELFPDEGTSVALNADEMALIEAYGQFKQEAHHLDPDYQPQTVNTDGWLVTQKAWQALFVTITIIECFLHAFLKIRNRCKKRWQALWPDIQQQTADFLAWA